MTPQRFVRSMLLVVICIASCAMQAQSPVQSPVNDHPGILGTLDQGRYSNHTIGFSIQLDNACAIVNEAAATEWVHRFPQRLALSIRCTDYTVTLVSWPLHSDESADLIFQASPSVAGAIDGLRENQGLEFKKRGGWQKVTAGGTKLIVQELAARGESGEEVLGLYNGFLIGRRYISILVIGPRKNDPQLRHIVATLKLDVNPAK